MFDEPFLWFVLIGFIAQLIDGALGMPPAYANVHAAEVFTTAASGIFHSAAKNVDWRVFWRRALFGSAGGVAGAFLVSHLHTDTLRPVTAACLFGMGVVVIWKGLRPRIQGRVFTGCACLASSAAWRMRSGAAAGVRSWRRT